jgi:hypothetical protein
MAPHKNQKSFIFLIWHFSSILSNLTPKKRTIKTLYCVGKEFYSLLCPLLRTAPPTGEAAKLINDVTEITSYFKE